MLFYVESSHIRRKVKEVMIKYAQYPMLADALGELQREILREEKSTEETTSRTKLIRIEDEK